MENSTIRAVSDPMQSVEQALARIALRDADVRAWVQVDVDGARSQARACDTAAPLAGLTLGVKDIVQVDGLKWECGSRIDIGAVATKDAALVAELRCLGAVIIGKTTTTEYAYLNPTSTRNPHDLGRSPGGSSSGSAAAVADGQVDFAIGTQTAGSIIRPAAFCGVVGYKPTYNRVSMAGVKGISPTLDTAGWLARDVATVARVKAALLGASSLDAAVRIGLCRTEHWPIAEPEMQAAFEAFGRRVDARETAAPPARFDEWHAAIMRYEMRRELATERLQHADLMSPALRTFLEPEAVSRQTYEAVLEAVAAFDVESLFGGSDILIAPAAPGEAVPFGTTGNPAFNRFTTLLELPTITIPFAHGRTGLPLGLQLIGRRDQDDLVLATAARFEALLTDRG